MQRACPSPSRPKSDQPEAMIRGPKPMGNAQIPRYDKLKPIPSFSAAINRYSPQNQFSPHEKTNNTTCLHLTFTSP
jgi:hypothetical protein